MQFPHAVEQNVEVQFQGRIQKQTYSENDYLLAITAAYGGLSLW
jgi:hypothetical protein